MLHLQKPAFLESLILTYVYSLMQTKFMISLGSVTFHNYLLLEVFFLDLNIRGLWTFAEPYIAHKNAIDGFKVDKMILNSEKF